MSGWSDQAVTLIVLTEQTTGYSGLFGYSPRAGTGNLIFSVAAAAGTDPWGNAYPAGISTSGGSSTITGTWYVIDGDGAFWYSAAPAAGNLIMSLASVAGTDAHGNAYPEGLAISAGLISGVDFVIDNAHGALLAYSGTPGPGTLAGSWSYAGGTDKYGNTYPAGESWTAAGVTVQLYSTGLSFDDGTGTAASVNGSTGFIDLSSGVTGRGDTVCDMQILSGDSSPNGVPQIVISPSLATPNTESIVEIFGDLTVEDAAGPLINPAVRLGVNGSAFLGWELNGTAAYTEFPQIEGEELTGTHGKYGWISLQGAQLTAHPDHIEIRVNSSDSVSPSNSQIIYWDTGGTGHTYLNIDDAGGSLVGQVAGVALGTTPASGDSWHGLGTPSGWSVTQARYIASGLANFIVIDIQMTAPSGGATSATFPNSLPSAYQPAANRDYPLAITGSTAAEPRLFVGANGAVSVNGLPSGFTGTVGVTILVPLN